MSRSAPPTGGNAPASSFRFAGIAERAVVAAPACTDRLILLRAELRGAGIAAAARPSGALRRRSRPVWPIVGLAGTWPVGSIRPVAPALAAIDDAIAVRARETGVGEGLAVAVTLAADRAVFARTDRGTGIGWARPWFIDLHGARPQTDRGHGQTSDPQGNTHGVLPLSVRAKRTRLIRYATAANFVPSTTKRNPSSRCSTRRIRPVYGMRRGAAPSTAPPCQ